MTIKKIIIYIFIFIIGYFSEKINITNFYKLDLVVLKNTVESYKIYFEVSYYILASLMLLVAIEHFWHDKNLYKHGIIEYTHKLYIEYVDTILKMDNEFSAIFLEKIPEDIENTARFNDFLNKLDTFSAAFVYELADINIGKKLIGSTFCNQIDRLRPKIIEISGPNYTKDIENIFELYNKWNN